MIAVIGTGMAGFGAARRLNAGGVRPVVFDKNGYFGGHTASFRDPKGFLFDLGPHISFTKDVRIQQLLAESVDDRFSSLQVTLDNYWHGIRLTHPAQVHLNGLPHELIVEIVADFVAAQHAPPEPIANYEDWLVASYGRRFAELFPMQYGRKYHTTPAANMTTDWLGPRMYRPKLEEMLRGALGAWTPNVHYISSFRYPSDGGFVSYLKDFPEIADLRLGHEVVAIDPRARSIRFSNGLTATYSSLISSVPLPDLIGLIAAAPRDVVEASLRLACTTCVLVNVGVNRSDLSAAHMTYVYDDDIVFTRLSFPHMLATSNAPAGCGSIQAEIYFSTKYRPLNQSTEALVDQSIADLRRIGTLRPDDVILTRWAKALPYANVIFDLERAVAVATVHGYLRDIGIHYCGRYGDWGYMWTDDSFISGELAAESALP